MIIIFMQHPKLYLLFFHRRNWQRRPRTRAATPKACCSGITMTFARSGWTPVEKLYNTSSANCTHRCDGFYQQTRRRRALGPCIQPQVSQLEDRTVSISLNVNNYIDTTKWNSEFDCKKHIYDRNFVIDWLSRISSFCRIRMIFR